jgi:O-antigen/teichoic acid export membrane protein
MVAQLITLGQVIALARLLSPAEVGVFTAGTVLTGFLNYFVQGGLREGIVHRGAQIDDAAETVFRVTLVSGTLLTFGALAAAPVVALVFDNSTVGLVAAATSGSMLLVAFTNVPEALLQRRFSVRRRIIVGPAMSLTFAIVAVTLAACGWGVWSMVVGSYASYAVWVVCLWLICDWRPGHGHFSFKMWRELAKFGFPLMVSRFSYHIKVMAEAVIVGRVLGAAHLGQYRYAQRIAEIPEKGIIDVCSNALFPAFSRISGDKERLCAAYLSALRWSMIGAAPLTALMIALGEPAVLIVLGKPWHEAGIVVAAMAGVGIGRALESVSEEAIKGVGRTSLINWCTAAEVGGGLILVLILIRPLGLFGVGLALSITSVIVAIIKVGLARSVVEVPIKSLLRVLAPPLPAAALACAVTLYLEHFVLHSDSHPEVVAIVLLALEVVVFGLVYLAALSLVAPTTMRQLRVAVLRRPMQAIGRRQQR